MLSRLVIVSIWLYQRTLGRVLGGRCRFHPTCSQFAIEAVQLNGLVRGTGQAFWRILRCAPWSAGGVNYPKRLHQRHTFHRGESRG